MIAPYLDQQNNNLFSKRANIYKKKSQVLRVSQILNFCFSSLVPKNSTFWEKKYKEIKTRKSREIFWSEILDKDLWKRCHKVEDIYFQVFLFFLFFAKSLRGRFLLKSKCRNRVQMFISCPWLCDSVGWFPVKTDILRLVFLVGPISHNYIKLVVEKA